MIWDVGQARVKAFLNHNFVEKLFHDKESFR